MNDLFTHQICGMCAIVDPKRKPILTAGMFVYPIEPRPNGRVVGWALLTTGEKYIYKTAEREYKSETLYKSKDEAILGFKKYYKSPKWWVDEIVYKCIIFVKGLR